MPGTSTKGIPKAVQKVWKFVAGDQVMITRGRSKGRVARISSVKRDGRTSARTGRRESKKTLLHRKQNPRVYLDGGVHQVCWHAVVLLHVPSNYCASVVLQCRVTVH